jgi:hypothetical protein
MFSTDSDTFLRQVGFIPPKLAGLLAANKTLHVPVRVREIRGRLMEHLAFAFGMMSDRKETRRAMEDVQAFNEANSKIAINYNEVMDAAKAMSLGGLHK